MLLLAVAGAAVGVGAAVGPLADGDEPEGHAADDTRGDREAVGLSLAARGLRLELAATRVDHGGPAPLRLRLLDGAGRAVTDLDDGEAGVPMHLVVVRRDLATYVHVHPEPAADGWFSAEVELPGPGVYRAFVDVERAGERIVLGSDVVASGAFEPAPLPAARRAVEADGLTVVLTGSVRAGQESLVAFDVTEAGRAPVLEPHLGARGHLVALREGDLAYLHVHPRAGEEPGRVAFAADFPTPGSYRLFLQVVVDGRVRTAPFTLEVAR